MHHAAPLVTLHTFCLSWLYELSVVLKLSTLSKSCSINRPWRPVENNLVSPKADERDLRFLSRFVGDVFEPFLTTLGFELSSDKLPCQHITRADKKQINN